MPRPIPIALPMLGRRQLRLAAVAALVRATLNVRNVPVGILSPGDWNIPVDTLPALVVRTAHETKTSFQRGEPQFTTVCALEIKAVIAAPTASQAQDDIETLWYAIENALLLDWSLVRMTQQFATVETVMAIRAEGAQHIAGIAGSFACEYVEAFDPTTDPPPGADWPLVPTVPNYIEQITVTVDPVNVADATGTYPDASFPQAITPAPRTQGPDGRAEGYLVLTLDLNT
ncbi:conserved hypothetical protein [Burkholderia diffusa]|uniref:hypothetical protein n=1 Tax=Burkholderia diffusa TaxID=488732 RepID=UPI001CB2A4B5|nr:hypothetical protein [Burkholderia diffusa]CAG9248563.1 conserved hypothetical protein [Burkholderia diffusa]